MKRTNECFSNFLIFAGIMGGIGWAGLTDFVVGKIVAIGFGIAAIVYGIKSIKFRCMAMKSRLRRT